jgi:hypothetical protein
MDCKQPKRINVEKLTKILCKLVSTENKSIGFQLNYGGNKRDEFTFYKIKEEITDEQDI